MVGSWSYFIACYLTRKDIVVHSRIMGLRIGPKMPIPLAEWSEGQQNLRLLGRLNGQEYLFFILDLHKSPVRSPARIRGSSASTHPWERGRPFARAILPTRVAFSRESGIPRGPQVET